MKTKSNFEFGEEFKIRTKKFALRIIKLFQSLPKTEEAKIIGKQLLRSGTSVAANYRSVCRARSEKEFYSKISIVIKEADESLFWLEILEESGIFSSEKLSMIKQEANEIVAITVSIRSKLNKKKKLNNSKTS